MLCTHRPFVATSETQVKTVMINEEQSVGAQTMRAISTKRKINVKMRQQRCVVYMSGGKMRSEQLDDRDALCA
jgi:hypothetical protein